MSTHVTNTPLRIGIVGGGFSGTALAALLYRENKRPIDLVLFDKSGQFGAGPAYSTPFYHHLLNVRVEDMSAFDDDPSHFLNWLKAHPAHLNYFDQHTPIAQQFAPRRLYGDYLQDLLARMQSAAASQVRVRFETAEVIDSMREGDHVALILQNGNKVIVDKAIFALGNNPPSPFPFPVAPAVSAIANPWDYTAINRIDKKDDVLIVGTGLSMIDAVLSLYYQHHEGKIYALSRHGLLPLPHAEGKPHYELTQHELPTAFTALTKQVRAKSKTHLQSGGDWRAIIHALRTHLPALWQSASLADRKRFIRHLLPYWNIHRHRVHTEIMDLLSQLATKKQLILLGGRVMKVEAEENKSLATIKLRYSGKISVLEINCLINCMGPAMQMSPTHQPLIHALLKRGLATLDPLCLGFAVGAHGALQDAQGKLSANYYTLGAPTKGATWEIGAVPEIRKQIYDLSMHLLAMK